MKKYVDGNYVEITETAPPLEIPAVSALTLEERVAALETAQSTMEAQLYSVIL